MTTTGWPRRNWNAANARLANAPFADVFSNELGDQSTVQPPIDRSAPDPHEVAYFGWSLDDPRDQHPEEAASAAFARRYGRPPEFVFETIGNNLLVGPIPEVTLWTSWQ